jgi:NADH dehydrogenase/NADH:ubiquinone oxidoreductase subunit G
VGALTLKSFPFVLRDWDIKSFESIDPTDSFGQNTKAYTNKNKIIKIEPLFSNSTSHTWITDKGRHFFESIFHKKNQLNNSMDNDWKSLFIEITKILYLHDICNFKKPKKHFLIIIFESVSLETINLLLLIAKIHSFIKIKKANNLKINSDLESNFQTNAITNISKLSTSSLCLLITTNTRFEGPYLNLKLRQRYSHGNFKLFSIGSFIDLTFPIITIGSNISVLRSFIEGTHTFCIDFVNAKNPTIITNSESFKKQEIQNFLNIFKITKCINLLNKIWNGFNIINSSLYETGVTNQTTFSSLTYKDFNDMNSLYIINTNLSNLSNFKKLIKSKFIELTNQKSFCINQDHINTNFYLSKLINFEKYLFLPNNALFDSKETFINTEGLIKVDTKIIKNKKDNWQLIRKFNKNIRKISFINNNKDKNLLFFNNISISNFKNLTNFQYNATQNLTHLNYLIGIKNKPFSILVDNIFKTRFTKSISTKLKYWLDDFYIGGKDRFCQNSLIMINCSENIKSQTTNFL